VEGLWRGGTGLQHCWNLLEQLLYLGRESGGGSLGAPWFNKRSSTCLRESAAQGRMQYLPVFRGDYRKAKMSEKIHAKERSCYGCRSKIECEILTGNTDGKKAETPSWDGLPFAPNWCGPMGGSAAACGKMDKDALESTRN
jgi:hypothetical protein